MHSRKRIKEKLESVRLLQIKLQSDESRSCGIENVGRNFLLASLKVKTLRKVSNLEYLIKVKYGISVKGRVFFLKIINAQGSNNTVILFSIWLINAED